MRIGDLVTSRGFGTRLGSVEKIWDFPVKPKRLMVKVLWGNGETGNYYVGQLEVIEK